MSKKESSFYVIHKPDDAFDRVWASATATTAPPKPDEGLWTDRKDAATYEGDGWVSVLVNPDPNKLPGFRSGQLFAFEITANELLAPMRFTTRLRGEVVTSTPTSIPHSISLSDKKGEGEAPKDEQHRHQLPLDSPVIEMTYLGKKAHTLDDPVSNPFRQTYLLPKRGLCSCGSSPLLPSSCAEGRVQVRYWFEITGQCLNSSESRLRWKGKNRLPDIDERQPAQVLAIPVRITSERYSPRCIPSQADLPAVGFEWNEPPVSVSQRNNETTTTRYYLEDERPKLAGFDVSSLKLVHRMTTPEKGPASLHARLEVSLGIYQHGPRYRELCDSFASAQLSVTFRLVRQTTIIPPASSPAPQPEDRKGKAKAKAKSTPLPHGVMVSPFVESDTVGVPLRVDKPYISTDLRLVGPPGVKERAQELFLKFDGDLVLEGGASTDQIPTPQHTQPALPVRVQTCNAEIRYDLVADLTNSSGPSTCSIRAQDVRIDLPTSLLTGLQQQQQFRPPVPTQTSETFPSRMLSIAREASLFAPSQYEWMSGLSSETLASLIPVSTSAPRAGPSHRYRAAGESEGSRLPAYESSPPSSSSVAALRDEKRQGGIAAIDATGESKLVPPPAYPASCESTAGHASESEASSSSAGSGPGRRFSRMLSSFGRGSAPQAETAAARRPLGVSAPIPPPPTSLVPHPAPEQEAPPPSWEDTVRDDAIEDWVAASLAIGTDDPAPSPPSKVERSCM